ncbi:TonB system biopolymer transport component [Vibrio ponticus]|nr:TonB system biopolymer transport component [Vibrio ponticus]
MYQMVAGLKSIVEQDAPIKLQQRQERIAKLESLMTRADVSDAEKYRRILEAYQIEMDYGTKLGLYQGQIQVAGEAREADILHLGRVALVARSLNGTKFWSWDKQDNAWVEVDSAMKSELDKAYGVAAKQTAPSLITLPVSLIAEVK